MTPKQTKHLVGTIVTNMANAAIACQEVQATGKGLDSDDMEYLRKLQATLEFNANHTEWHLFDRIIGDGDATE